MKKLLSVLLAVALVLSMSVVSFAAGEEQEIAITPDNFGVNVTNQTSEVVVWGENTVTANELNQFSIKLPTALNKGESVVIHIKGTADEQFRVWLLAANAVTASNQWKSADAGYVVTEEFEYYIELNCDYFDAEFEIAEEVNFKAPSYDAQLMNFTLSYVGVIYGTMADVEAAKVAEVQPQIDAAKALVEAVKTVDVADQAALDAAVAEAQAAIDAIPDYGFATLVTAISELQASVDTVLGEVALAGFQTEIDAVNAALESAKAAGNDVAAIKAAYDSALAAVDKMETDGGHLAPVAEKVKELKNVISEIKDLHKAATAANEEAKAAEEAAAKEAEAKAAEEAAAKEAATQTTIIIVVVVVVVVAILAVVLVVLKKKKK